MAALMEDGAAIGVGMAATVVVSMALCYLSVKLINWSAFRQVSWALYRKKGGQWTLISHP